MVKTRLSDPKLWAVIISVILALLTGTWALGEKLSERPTLPAVEKMIEPYRQDIKEMRHEQVEQRRTLDRIEYNLDVINRNINKVVRNYEHRN